MLQVELINSKTNTTLNKNSIKVLTFIPTPIGNLNDISYRAVAALAQTTIYLCEDTRVTKKLLSLLSEKLNIDFNIQDKQFISLHSHNEERFVEQLTIEYFENNNISYVSDAGMPCVSDPGALLVNFCIKNNIPYDVLPGANALLTAYAMSGFNKKEFTFFGFLQHKGKVRASELQSILDSKYLTILYESPHRLLKFLEEISSKDPNREIFMVKELTKMYQNTYKGTALELYTQFKNENIRGEWVVIVDCPPKQLGEALTVEDIESIDLPPKQKAKLLSKLTGQKTKDIYNKLLQ
jgi:16S rRNA (cytidine1402-2'-O)-methyltransferase